MTTEFTLRFYATREADTGTKLGLPAAVGMQAGPTRQFKTLGELDDFMAGLSSEAHSIAWVTWPDGKEARYADPNPKAPLPSSK